MKPVDRTVLLITCPRKLVVAFLLLCVLCSAVLSIVIPPPPVSTVLMFHSITDDLDADSPDISPARFRAFVTELAQEPRRLEITTDRTDSSIYSEFFRTLREHGMTATIFILPLEVGGEDTLTWPQVLEMDRAGFAVGSHSLTHAWLPDLTDEEIACELCFSKALIEQNLGHAIATVAYPYGAFDLRVKRIARSCGYTRAYTTAPGRSHPDDDAMAIKRVYVNEQTAENPLLKRLALSGFYIATRELALSLLPIEMPRRPEEWSYEEWRRDVKALALNSPHCSSRP